MICKINEINLNTNIILNVKSKVLCIISNRKKIHSENKKLRKKITQRLYVPRFLSLSFSVLIFKFLVSNNTIKYYSLLNCTLNDNIFD